MPLSSSVKTRGAALIAPTTQIFCERKIGLVSETGEMSSFHKDLWLVVMDTSSPLSYQALMSLCQTRDVCIMYYVVVSVLYVGPKWSSPSKKTQKGMVQFMIRQRRRTPTFGT